MPRWCGWYLCGKGILMKAFRLLIAPLVFSVCCATARADLTVQQVGPVVFGNSFTVSVTVFNPDLFDLYVVEVVGDTFETLPPAPPIVTAPVTWTGTRVSPTLIFASGLKFLGNLFLDLTFNGAAPVNGLTLNFSAFLPGDDSASASGALVWEGGAGGAFAAFTPAPITDVRRASLAAVPVPGAVFLGMMGFGLVGFARKRLR